MGTTYEFRHLHLTGPRKAVGGPAAKNALFLSMATTQRRTAQPGVQLDRPEHHLLPAGATVLPDFTAQLATNKGAPRSASSCRPPTSPSPTFRRARGHGGQWVMSASGLQTSQEGVSS